MQDHIQIKFSDILPEQQEWVIAHLAEAGFDGFEQGDEELKAFVEKERYDPVLLKEMAFKYQLNYSEATIAAQNWNSDWESNFEPVVVDDFVAIRADFHQPMLNVKHEIIITPKMSFGTGHHATTCLMIQQMREMKMGNKTVLDFGTGTGILAILAEKLGAKKIIAIDNDEWSIENAAENSIRNNCSRIELANADKIPTDQKFDIILANINKHIIVGNLGSMIAQLNQPGKLLLSGVLTEDEDDMLIAAQQFKLEVSRKTTQVNWLSICFIY